MKNQNKNAQNSYIFTQMLEGTQLAEATELDIAINDDVCVIHKAQMTVLEVAEVIATLTTIASDLTVVLAAACGFCDNCGQRDAAPNSRTLNCTGFEVLCPRPNPAGGWRGHAGELVPPAGRTVSKANNAVFAKTACALEDAGIPKDAKLEAFADDEGEIVVTEAEYQKDINDVSPGIISVLVSSGVCIAELDELIMDEEIVYGA